MWKLLLAFVVFAALALFVLSKGGPCDDRAHGYSPARNGNHDTVEPPVLV